MRITEYLIIVAALALVGCDVPVKSTETHEKMIVELNRSEIAEGERVVALTGGTLIDGTGRDPVPDALVLVRKDVIEYAGPRDGREVPEEALVIDAKGMTIVPGLIDAHYHNGYSQTMPSVFLARGITSVRDPGAWMFFYDSARRTGRPMPRLFLTGPHIDMYPPAYPDNSYLVKDPEEGRRAVEMFARQGATAIKVYFRLSVAVIREICEAAHEQGLPVTGHLEIANARDAINAGLDGIEHITSFGTSLLPMPEAERYKQKVSFDNAARERGRYEVWSSLKLDRNPSVDSLIAFLARRKTFICPTLGVFERQPDRGDSVEVSGFGNMLRFTGMAHKGGARIVVGSHTWVPYAEKGYAYFREMELLQEAGIGQMAIIQAATIENARFLQIEERLGSLEKGKVADLIIVDGDPLSDIAAMRKVKRVMLNGVWIEEMSEGR